MPSDFALMMAKAQMDPGWFAGMGTGPQMLGGQIFPGHPAAQEFDYREVGPQGTDLVAGAGMPLALMAGSFNLRTKPIQINKKKYLSVEWFDTYKHRDSPYHVVSDKGFDFISGLKEIINRANKSKADSIVFQPLDIKLEGGNSMLDIVNKFKIPLASYPVASKYEKRGADGLPTYEIDLGALKTLLRIK